MCFKNKFLNSSETKKLSTESFLTFRELQPLVSCKRVSYKKNTCICNFFCQTLKNIKEIFFVARFARALVYLRSKGYFKKLDKLFVQYRQYRANIFEKYALWETCCSRNGRWFKGFWPFFQIFRKCLMNIKNSYFEKLNNEKKYRFPFTLKW